MAERKNFAALAAVILLFTALILVSANDCSHRLKPRVLIATLVRNKAHSLPYFLWAIENLDYPKDRISLWIRSDHSVDNSTEQLIAWLGHVQDEYHNVDYEYDDTVTAYPDQKGNLHWNNARFYNVMRLRQAGLDAGRKLWADYVFIIDADVILKNPNTLQLLIAQEKTIIAPLLNVTASENYANFWGDMDANGYYKRSDNYFDVKERKIKGCFPVAMVHSAVLIDLNHAVSDKLAYYPLPTGYQGPYDDIIVFAHSAKFADAQMYIYNEEFFGFVPLPMESFNTVGEEAEQFVHVRTEAIVDDVQLERVPYLYPPALAEEKDKLGFDQIYMINLKRRPDRRVKMEKCFEELLIDYKYMEAVDGKLLNVSYLQSLKVRMLPGYKDPYHGRPLTRGEIGCFLSHHMVWMDVLENGYEKVLVFEDDIRFEPYFRTKLKYMMREVKNIQLKWDLIYLGRRRVGRMPELAIPRTPYIVRPGYSYWTIAYMLSIKGAGKLVNSDPLSKLMALDEYISLMFNGHPKDEWKNQFTPRNLLGFSVDPLLVFPSHYTGEPGYVTDTDNSDVLNFDDNGILHEGRWIEPDWDKVQSSLRAAPTPAANNNMLRGDIDDLPQGKEEL